MYTNYVTPLMAGCTKEFIARSAEMAARNIIDVLEGKSIASVVNKHIFT